MLSSIVANVSLNLTSLLFPGACEEELFSASDFLKVTSDDLLPLTPLGFFLIVPPSGESQLKMN